MKVQISLSYEALLALHRMTKATGRSREELIVAAIRNMIENQESFRETQTRGYARGERPPTKEIGVQESVESTVDFEDVNNYESEARTTEAASAVEELYSSGIDNAILEIFRKHGEELGLQDIQRLFMIHYVENLHSERSWWLEKTSHGEPRFKQHVRARVRKLTLKGTLQSPRRGFYRLTTGNQ